MSASYGNMQVVIVSGTSCVGKTTLCQNVTDANHWPLISCDAIISVHLGQDWNGMQSLLDYSAINFHPTVSIIMQLMQLQELYGSGVVVIDGWYAMCDLPWKYLQKFSQACQWELRGVLVESPLPEIQQRRHKRGWNEATYDPGRIAADRGTARELIDSKFNEYITIDGSNDEQDILAKFTSFVERRTRQCVSAN